MFRYFMKFSIINVKYFSSYMRNRRKHDRYSSTCYILSVTQPGIIDNSCFLDFQYALVWMLKGTGK